MTRKSKVPPRKLAVSVEQACKLATECWRLGQLAEQEPSAAAVAGVKRSVRLLNDLLHSMEFQVMDFAGRTYDAGMAPEVVEIVEDVSLVGGDTTIRDTVTPTLIWRGQVVSPGQIVLQRLPAEIETTQASDE